MGWLFGVHCLRIDLWGMGALSAGIVLLAHVLQNSSLKSRKAGVSVLG